MSGSWIAVQLAGGWCLLALAAQVATARAQGRAPNHAPAAGSPAAGSRYAFTGAMLPWAKESVRMNPVSYGLGLTLHLGLFASLLSLVLSSRVPAPFALAGALAGLALLGKRLLKPQLRGLSNPDDFLSCALVTGFCALAAVAAWLPGARPALPWAGAALLLYIPLGKLRHSVFFFLSRHHLGLFFGRRGVFPPQRSGR